MDSILGWDCSDDEESEEVREKAKREEMERRQKDAEEYRNRIRKSEEEYFEPRRKLKKKDPTSLSDALESELVTIGDDDLRDEYKIMMPRILKHFLGQQSEFKTELEEIDNFEDLKEFVFRRHQELREKYQKDEANDEHIELHNFLVQFNLKILRALTVVTKVGKVDKNVFDQNLRIFEECWMKAHNLLLEDNQVRFRNIFELFNNYDKEEVQEVIEETKKELRETLGLEDGMDKLISEFSVYTIKEKEQDEDYHVRETSPPPISRSFSEESLEMITLATSNLRIDGKSHRFQPREDQEEEEDACSASDSDDENSYLYKLFERDLTAPRINNVRPVETVKLEELDERIDEPMEIDNFIEYSQHKSKKNVKFVDFDSDRNTMRIFCHPLNWYRDDGDDGVTLAYADMTLKEGWTYLRTMEPPYQLIRHSHYKRRIRKETTSVNRLYKGLAYNELPLTYEGTIGSRVWFTEENMTEQTIDLGLQETYDSRMLRHCIKTKMFQILCSFRKCYSREYLGKRFYLTSALHRLALSRSEKQGIPYEKMKKKVVEQYKDLDTRWVTARVSSCLILSDWRLVFIHTSVFLNTEIKYFPTHMGNAFFLMLMKFLKEIFSYDWIEIKTLVFAFGGHESFELATIQRFLVYVQKLTAGRNIQIHWISNCWIDNITFDEIDGRVRKNQQTFEKMKKVNSGVESFIKEMQENGLSNMHFYKIHDLLIEAGRSCELSENRMEYILIHYMQYFVESCKIVAKQYYFEKVARNYATEYAENVVKFSYNKNKKLQRRVVENSY